MNHGHGQGEAGKRRMAMAAYFYEPEQSLWEEGGWKCPHCMELNPEATQRCECGLDRQELDGFQSETFHLAKLVIVQGL